MKLLLQNILQRFAEWRHRPWVQSMSDEWKASKIRWEE